MESYPDREFARFTKEAVHKGIIDGNVEKTLGAEWALYRWKKAVWSLYITLLFLSVVAVAVCAWAGVVHLTEMIAGWTAPEWLNAAWETVWSGLASALSFIGGLLSSLYGYAAGVAKWLYEWIALAASAVFAFFRSIAGAILAWMYNVADTVASSLSRCASAAWEGVCAALAFLAAGAVWIWEHIAAAAAAVFAFLRLSAGATLAWMYSVADTVASSLSRCASAAWEGVCAALAFLAAGAVWAWEHIAAAAAVVFAFLRPIAGAILAWMYNVADTVASSLSRCASAAWEGVCATLAFLAAGAAWVWEHIAAAASAVFAFLRPIAGAILAWMYNVADTVASSLSRCASAMVEAVGFVLGILQSMVVWVVTKLAAGVSAVFGFLRGCAVGTYAWLLDMAANSLTYLAQWYWTSLASVEKIVALFAISVAADRSAASLARRERHPRLIRPLSVFGAAVFSWMLGHIIELCAIHYDWYGFEVVSMGMWSLIPIFVALMTNVHPRIHAATALVILALHIPVYACGVSGSIMIAFDVILAVAVIIAADVMKARLGEHATVLRFTAMGIICFLLYCCGFVWDQPSVLHYQDYAAPDSLLFSRRFLMVLLAATALLVGWHYRRKKAARTRHDALFSLLLLATLLFSWFPTGMLLGFIRPGVSHVFSSGGYGVGIFSVNILLIILGAWACWFSWSLWLLVESSDRNSGLMAQIAVTALLASLETRYLEVVFRISFVAGLTVLPVMLIVVLAEVHIIRRWMGKVKTELAAPDSGRE